MTASAGLLERSDKKTADKEQHTSANLRGNGLLNGKVAIITGASRGIGAASARIFAASGAKVVLAARDAGAIATVAKDILSKGGQAVAVPTDVGDPVSVERLVQQTIDAYGRLDAAFNNAGDGHMPTALADIKVEDFERAIRVNLTGVFLSMKYEIPAMLRNGGGAIVNMSSTAGLTGVKGSRLCGGQTWDYRPHQDCGVRLCSAEHSGQRNCARAYLDRSAQTIEEP